MPHSLSRWANTFQNHKIYGGPWLGILPVTFKRNFLCTCTPYIVHVDFRFLINNMFLPMTRVFSHFSVVICIILKWPNYPSKA